MALNYLHERGVLLAPRHVFENIRIHPRWMGASCVVVCLSILCAYLVLPFSRKILLDMIALHGNEEQMYQMLALTERFQYIGLLTMPVSLFIKWLFVSTVLFFGVLLLDAEGVSFKAVLTVVIYSEFVFLLMGYTNLLLLSLRGVEAMTGAADLQAIPGLDILLPDKNENTILFTFLNNFNCFSLLYIVVLSTGTAVVAQVERLKSYTLVSLVWLLTVLGQAALSTLLAGIQRMAG